VNLCDRANSQAAPSGALFKFFPTLLQTGRPAGAFVFYWMRIFL
jgi:hypothetical protein